MNKEEILKDIKEFIRKQGDKTFENWHKFTIAELKDGGRDVSTNFDRSIEQEFHDYVMEKYPDFGFVGEEHEELNKDGDYIWMIDPIDGTKFFVAGVPLWGSTVSLVKKGESIAELGVIYNPVSKQIYHASKGSGAFMNDEQIEMTRETDITKLQMVFDLTATQEGENDFTDEIHNELNTLEKRFYRTRMIGNGAFGLAWLAQGFFGAFVDPIRRKEKLVDISAGLLIATEAGAVVHSHDVHSDLEIIHNIVARPEVVEQILKILDE